jgi:TonB family protein
MISEWLVSALWRYSLQAGVVVAVTAACLALLRVHAPRVRLRLLQAALLVCLLALPGAALVFDTAGIAVSPARHTASRPALITASASVAAQLPRSGPSWSAILARVCVGGAVCRFAWLLVGLRRLRRGVLVAPPERIEAEASVLQGLLGTRARIEWRHDIVYPATMGLFPPRVLLPATLVEESPARRRAIVCHELHHVRRGDWAFVVVEEAVRTILWFHPAVRWLIAELRLAREQVVDRAVVTLFGERRSYLEVLYSFAQAPASWTHGPAVPFFGRHQLERRIVSLVREVTMSRSRTILTTLLTAVLLGGGAAASGYYVPIDVPTSKQPGGEQPANTAPGPIERTATAAPSRAALPKRLQGSPFEFPAEARDRLASALVTVQVVIDETGQVAEARVLRYRAEWLPDADAATVAQTTKVLGEHTVSTIRGWRYEPPSPAPIMWTMTVFYNNKSRVGVPEEPAGEAEAERRVAADPSGLATTPPDGGAVRVGGPVRAPERLTYVSPVYPQDAMDRGVQGVVIIELTIDTSGAVSDARVMRSIPMLDDAALDAVRQWKYRPTLLNGVAVPVIMTVTINFAPAER